MHTWSVAIMEKLLQDSYYDKENTGGKPDLDSEIRFDSLLLPSPSTSDDKERSSDKEDYEKPEVLEAPILIAAQNGITEIIDQILKNFPTAIHDTNSASKNVILLASEYRQPKVYEKLLQSQHITKHLLLQRDNNGNNALHLAAMLREFADTPSAVLQMQWEIKWYEYVKWKMPKKLWSQKNKKGMIPDEVFRASHRDLMYKDVEWLMKTSESCSIVATLIATVAFSTSASVPGGIDKGEPVLKKQRMFDMFAISSLVALCFSLTAVIVFLGILTSRHQARHFASVLPRKLITGLTALFIAIASMMVSFCGGHFFLLKNVLRGAQVAEYLVIFVPVAIFIIAQFPLYFKLFLASVNKVPERDFIAAR